MGKPSDSPGFKELMQVWNAKLYATGFNDAEYLRGGELILKDSNALVKYRSLDETSRDHRSEFFNVVAACIKQTKFDSKSDRIIMKLFARGLTQAAIKRRLGIKGHRCKVYNPIYRYLKEWGLK